MTFRLTDLPASVRARMGMAIPTKPARAAAGTGCVAMRKAKATAAIVAQPRGGNVVTFPLYTTTEANAGGHWRAKNKRAQSQRETTALFVRRLELPPLPVVVTMTRIGRKMLDDDNAVGAMKHVRDSIAAIYGVDDGDHRYQWVVAPQEIGEYAVRIKVEPAT